MNTDADFSEPADMTEVSFQPWPGTIALAVLMISILILKSFFFFSLDIPDQTTVCKAD